MLRIMSPVIGAVLLCAQSLPVMAADNASSSNGGNADQQLRDQIEAKRDQLTGAASLAPATQNGVGTLLDTPVETDDAPAQVQQP